MDTDQTMKNSFRKVAQEAIKNCDQIGSTTPKYATEAFGEQVIEGTSKLELDICICPANFVLKEDLTACARNCELMQ